MSFATRRMARVGFASLMALAGTAAAEPCTLEYMRADNMWAAQGRPDGFLGTESITVQPGQTKVFVTDWKYEKQRNDGTNYYGSHVRIVRNVGKGSVKLVFKGGLAGMTASALRAALEEKEKGRALGMLDPGKQLSVRHDLMEVSCPAEDQTALIGAPTGLNARQASPTTIELSWQPVTGAKEYRVYVDPQANPAMKGKPGVIGGTGTRWVISVPLSMPPQVTYQAAIETVGANGAVSKRVEFNPVTYVRTPTGPGGTPLGGGPGVPPGGGTPPAGGTGAGTPPGAPGASGQQCPPGQFVTGMTSSGGIVCGKP